jgi:hypothetical protein
MHFFRKVRLLSAWSRALLVGFVLAFGLNGIAHAAHQHDPASATTSLHSTACGYCLTFDNLAGTPAHTTVRASVDLDPFIAPVSDEPAPSVRIRPTAQPRAPPALI